MKQTFISTLFVAVLLSVTLSGCDSLSKMVKNHDANAEYVQTPNPMEMHGDQVKINITGTFKPNYFNKKAGLIFQPEINYTGGVLLLKPIFLKGESVESPGGQVIRYEGGKFSYQETIAYKPEYDGARLTVNPAVYPAKSAKGVVPATAKDALALKKALPLGMRTLAEGINTTSLSFDTKSSTPSFAPDKYEKETIIPKSATLYFLVDMDNLNLNLPLNKKDLTKAMVAEMETALSGNMPIKDIKILAWASPEGEESRNDNLSKNRSTTGEKYFRSIYDKVINKKAKALKVKAKDLKKDLPLTVEAKGEDWEGFLKSLRESSIAEKNTIINVVTAQTERSRREQEIRNMTVIYKQIEDEILPPLRRADMLINFLEIKKTDAEIAQLSTNDPAKLSLEELLYAATLTDKNETKLQIYKSSTEIYPEDWRAFNNLGFVSIQMQNYEAATTPLEKANALNPNHGSILNNMGILALAKGDFANARSYFTTAQNQKDPNAASNAAVLSIKEGNYAAAISNLQSKKCTYNLGLAQLLSGNTAAAQETLKCAPESAAVFYLQAICEARAKNASALQAALKKACEADAAYKTKALKDVEFKDFKSIVLEVAK